MYKQLLFCLETNKRAGTDWIYIKETIDNFYNLPNTVKLSQIYMGSKTKYNSKEIIDQISKIRKDYKLGETYIIYCIDVDDFETNPNHVNEFNNISNYCDHNSYELIWFCHDIEDVYLGRRLSDQDKVKESANFRRKNSITSISPSSLSSNNTHQIHSSNILSILDKYLKKK